jgi:imidazolonepropionase-like amidohydrolase
VAAVQVCLAAGVDGIEHCTCLSPRGLETPADVVAALAQERIWVCPTLGRVPGSEPSPQALEVMARTGYTVAARLEQVGRFAGAGVRLVSGSDAGIHPAKPHGVLPHAVAELVLAGVAPGAALASATSSAARACGVHDRTGRLRAGLDADLLIVDGDPTERIADLTRVRVVVARGREVVSTA